MNSKIAFVICSRTDSERVLNKPFRKINGVPLIEHLIRRLQKVGIPIWIAVPEAQVQAYNYLGLMQGVHIHASKLSEDPLGRTQEVAVKHNLSAVIRVTHDKILVQEKDVLSAIEVFEKESLDYLYGSKFIPGTGFEIISVEALSKAADKYKNVEFIGYSVRAVTAKSVDFNPRHPSGSYRFLIDFPEDLQFFDVLFSRRGDGVSLNEAVRYLNQNPEIKLVNAQPKVTIYTCAHNAEKFIERCALSVSRQKHFQNMEFILIDDHSNDGTCEAMAKFCLKHKNAKWIRNPENIGLASSSNIALKAARGKYILRLDADDFFVSITAVLDMINEIESTDCEVVYPNNYFGSMDVIQKGKDSHHIGGAIFDKRAINHFKFTEGLRGYEGLDFFLRAKDQLRVGYLNKPMFFYTQHSKSMSKTNLRARQRIKQEILDKFEAFPLEDDDCDEAIVI